MSFPRNKIVQYQVGRVGKVGKSYNWNTILENLNAILSSEFVLQ